MLRFNLTDPCLGCQVPIPFFGCILVEVMMKDSASAASLGWMALVIALSLLLGCVTTSPRFPTDVHSAYGEEDMRRMETERLQIYYPEGQEDEARQMAARLERCLVDLEERLPRPTDWGLVPVFMPDVEFNNAYVACGPGDDPQILVPTSFTTPLLQQSGYTPSPSAVGCHEMVHYVHLIQIHGFYSMVNRLIGPSINPQAGFDLWFFEGLATYYEGELVEGVGRYGSPIWETLLAAGISEEPFEGGQLSEWDRAIPVGGHYLFGSYFVAHLVEEYGEERLWQLIDRQGESTFFPFAMNRRFRKVYGRDMEALIDEFAVELNQRFELRERPDTQERLRWMGRRALFETGPEDEVALFRHDVDQVPILEIEDATGEVVLSQRLPDVRPLRSIRSLQAIDGLRFSPDGQSLVMLVNHQGRSAPQTSVMLLDISSGRWQTVIDDSQAVAVDITPDGQDLILASVDGQRVAIDRVALDAPEESAQRLWELPGGAYVSSLRLSPSGETLAMSLMEDERWSVMIADVESAQFEGQWSVEGAQRPVYAPYWTGEEQLLVAAATDDGGIQVYELDQGDETSRRRSDAPFMMTAPQMRGDSLVALNREGWGWTLDAIDGDEPMERQEETLLAFHEPRLQGYDPDPARRVPVLKDEAYSSLDGLFRPRLRLPQVMIFEGGDEIELGLGVSGRDELGTHNWAADMWWDFRRDQPSGSLAYIFTGLAPWMVTAQGLDNRSRLRVLGGDESDEDLLLQQRDRLARLELQRSFFGNTTIWVEASAAEFERESAPGVAGIDSRLIGALAGFRYETSRSSAYGGIQEGWQLATRAGAYPRWAGSDFDLDQGRAQLSRYQSLPFSSRHQLRISARGHRLGGVPNDLPLMRVGGFTGLEQLTSSEEPLAEPLAHHLVPRQFRFSEPLRGYEDLGLSTNRVAIGDVQYRYPFIIDRGRPATLGIFPSAFVRQLDLEFFGSAATRFDGDFHAAVGASLDLSMILWRAPLRFRYQVAQRLVDDERLVHTLSSVIGGSW